MTNWELLIDADMSITEEWQFSAPTTVAVIRVEQENAPELGRFALGQTTVDKSEFLNIGAYPSRSETTRITLNTIGERCLAIHHRYSQFPEGVANTWRIKVYGGNLPFEPPVSPVDAVITLDARIAGAIPLAEKGIPLGVASLDANGLVEEDQLPSSGLAELVTANLEAVDALAAQVAAIVIPPLPTLAELEGEPQGAELRARQYTDEKVGGIVIPPPPTLADLGGEPKGAEARAKAYVDQRFPITATPTTDIRINCGASIEYTAADGKIWGKDAYFNFGNADASYLGLVGATYDFVLFNYSRSGGSGFNYKIPLPNGNYVIELGFSENFHSGVGSRRFNVDIEGVRVLSNFDIRATAGARYSAIKRSFPVTVSDGELNIVFGVVTDAPQVNNIRVYSV